MRAQATSSAWAPQLLRKRDKAAMAFVTVSNDFHDPKSHLTHFCQLYCQRPILRGDVEYLTYELGEQYQAVVLLHCMKANAFPGRISSNQKDAEWSAAEQALKAFTSLTEMVLLPAVKVSKFGIYEMDRNDALQSQHQVKSRWQAQGMPSHVRPKLEWCKFFPDGRCNKGDACPFIHEVPQAPGSEESALDPKTRLNAMVMKIFNRVLSKGEVYYQTVPVMDGFQASVTFDNRRWSSKISTTEKEAEHSAAAVALESIQQEALRPNSCFQHLLCKDFSAGHCERGNRCTWFHAKATVSRWRPRAADAEERFEAPPKFVEERPRPETFEDHQEAPEMPSDWTVEEVVKWITTLQGGAFALHADLFQAEQVDGEKLSALTANSLKDLGMSPLGPRKILLSEIQSLFQ